MTEPDATRGRDDAAGTVRAATVLDENGVRALLDALRADGRTVLGPVARGPAVVVEEMASLDDLARGRDDQAPGRYRFTPVADAALFGPTTPARGWKRWFHHESTVLVRITTSDGGSRVEVPPPASPSLALFGIRSCDLAALAVLDGVLATSTHPDPQWTAARTDTVVVATACTDPADTCFCASFGTGPSPGHGADIVLTELPGEPGDAVRVVAEAATAVGADLLDGLTDSTPARPGDLEASASAVADAARAQVRHLDTDAARRLPEEHRHWAEIASRCLTCGNCTMVCPTCFCSSVTEHTELSDDVAERRREWASCFSLDFSEIHGGQIRTSTPSRYRQWLMHKLVTWHDQFATSGCVGCGRCITWCPTGIDLTAEVPRFGEVRS